MDTLLAKPPETSTQCLNPKIEADPEEIAKRLQTITAQPRKRCKIDNMSICPNVS